MKIGDFLDLQRGPESMVRLAALPLVVLAIASLAGAILSQFTATHFFLALLFLALLSPVAYAVREHRLGRDRHARTRRGGERTPLVPTIREEE